MKYLAFALLLLVPVALLTAAGLADLPADSAQAVEFVPVSFEDATAAVAALGEASAALGSDCGSIGISETLNGNGWDVDVTWSFTYYVFGNDGGGCGPQTLSGCPSMVVTSCQQSRQSGPFSNPVSFYVPNPGSGNAVHIQAHGFQSSSPLLVLTGF